MADKIVSLWEAAALYKAMQLKEDPGSQNFTEKGMWEMIYFVVFKARSEGHLIQNCLEDLLKIIS